jgi:hypothetical protein
MSFVRLLAGTLAVLAVLGSPGRAGAWGDSGHMLVAEIAYRQMGLAERARAVQILKDAFVAGPEGLERFEEDLTAGLPNGASAADRDHYIFIRAATWPDMLRDGPDSDRPHPLHGEFHKPDWHFINLPYAPPGDAVTLPAAPVPTPAGVEPKDIISAIRLCAADVKAPGTSKRVRAARLCFLLHTYGDLHQPLHAAALFSTNRLPHGDQGGNKLLVRIPGDTSDHDRITSIHSVFDGLFGHDTRLQTLIHVGERIDHDPKTTPEALKTPRELKDPMDWAKESLDDAIKSAYLDGKIRAVRGLTVKQFAHQDQIKVADVPRIPRDYESNALPVAERRVALGGYRLADALTELLAVSP